MLEGKQNGASLSLLAPLAVLPDYQKQGVGGIISHGLKLLTAAGIDLVFVLGHPGYYPRYGFKPAGVQGFEAPYQSQPSTLMHGWCKNCVQEL